MLVTALISVFAFAVLMGLMALGVIVQGKRLAGSCGGNPDSLHCGCSPKKQAACREKHPSTPALGSLASREEPLYDIKPGRR